MALFRWGHSWDAFHDLEREVDRLLQSVNLSFQGLRFGRQYPPVNLYELPAEYLITAELPGVKSEELELTIANGVLSMTGRHMVAVAAAPCRRISGGADSGPLTMTCVAPNSVLRSRSSNSTGQPATTASYFAMNSSRARGLRNGSSFAMCRS